MNDTDRNAALPELTDEQKARCAEIARLRLGVIGTNPELRIEQAMREGIALCRQKASALSAPPAEAKPVALPEGWVAVPREPTRAMQDEAQHAAIAAGFDGDGFTYADTYRAMLAAAPALPSAPQAQSEPEEDDTTAEWRRLALQFDGHRMLALGHIGALLADPAHAPLAEAFLRAPPLAGEQVLATRVAAIAQAQSEPRAPDAAQPEVELPAQFERLARRGEPFSAAEVVTMLREHEQSVRAELADRNARTEAAKPVVVEVVGFQRTKFGGELPIMSWPEGITPMLGMKFHAAPPDLATQPAPAATNGSAG